MHVIDAHCHLDSYAPSEQQLIVTQSAQYHVKQIVTVSQDLVSCRHNQALHWAHPQLVKPAYGYHPEQVVPTSSAIAELFDWIRSHQHEAIAIGEVGLPYYTRIEHEQKGDPFSLEPYVELLDRFVQLASELRKPIALHAIYEDAATTCDLLEKYSIKHAHFHWFKGDEKTIERIVQNGYFISFTPDILYEAEIQHIASIVPLQQMMIETDGPWPYEGPFAGQMTHPMMLSSIVDKIADLKKQPAEEVSEVIYHHTKLFYNIEEPEG